MLLFLSSLDNLQKNAYSMLQEGVANFENTA